MKVLKDFILKLKINNLTTKNLEIMNGINIIANPTKLERMAMKSVIMNWTRGQFKLGKTSDEVISRLKTDLELRHELSQQAFKYAKQF